MSLSVMFSRSIHVVAKGKISTPSMLSSAHLPYAPPGFVSIACFCTHYGSYFLASFHTQSFLNSYLTLQFFSLLGIKYQVCLHNPLLVLLWNGMRFAMFETSFYSFIILKQYSFSLGFILPLLRQYL